VNKKIDNTIVITKAGNRFVSFFLFVFDCIIVVLIFNYKMSNAFSIAVPVFLSI